MRIPKILTVATVAMLDWTACTGTITTGEPSSEAPVLTSPAEGEIRQPDEDIRFVATGGVVEFEVTLLADGEPTLKIWSGNSDDEGTAILSEGTFATGFSDLDGWREYGVRARRIGGSSPWSSYRPFRMDDGSEYIFDVDEIRDVYINLSQESIDRIDAEARPPGCVPYSRNYYPGTVTIDGETFANAGVRAKGGCGSSRSFDQKMSFKINLSDYSGGGETCPKTRRIRGLKRITLNNQVQDASATRERLAYDLYDLVGVPVPRRSHIRVHVNDELWGLYLNLESIDRRFLRRRYGIGAGQPAVGSEGMVYEGTYTCDFLPSNVPSPDGPERCFGAKFSGRCSTPGPGGDPIDYSTLQTFVDAIGALPPDGFYPAIRDIVEFDTYLSQWAADTVMNHWDGPVFGILNNFRVYHNPDTDKWVIFPTGMDQSWQTVPGFGSSVDPWQPGNVIARRCLQEKPCEDAFAARLREVVDLFETGKFADRALAIQQQIAADVESDPRRGGGFQNSADQAVEFINNRPEKIREWLAEHGY